MFEIDKKILYINSVICRNFDSIDSFSRGAISQNILAHLRNLVEHLMLKFYANGSDIDNTYQNICHAIKYVQTRGDLKVLSRFHDYLQIVASHYTLDEENSERLMLKYYVYLLKIRTLVHDKCHLDILENLEKFPLNQDPTLQEYYDKIADKVNNYSICTVGKSEKYYIQKIKPFIVCGRIYYEITFTPANDYASKFNRVIGFTSLEITDYYAVKFNLEKDCIEIMGKTMPIMVITGWEVAIRDCEFKNFMYLVKGVKLKMGYSEQQGLLYFLTNTGFSLVDLLDFPDRQFRLIRQQATQNARSVLFFEVLEICREKVKKQQPGMNILRYLLYHMNNKIIKMQCCSMANKKLSGLYLQNGCIPFDTMPFINSPLGHNPKLSDLFECVSVDEREHEILARYVKNNTEIKGQLFTSIKEIEGFENIPKLVSKFNNKLWDGHREKGKLVIENDQIFINEYKNNTCVIIEELNKLAQVGVLNYANTVLAWLNGPYHNVDSPEKREALIKMFENSQVALIYGAAGTGKSTMINHVANFFADKKKLFLAQTNPAVDNLKRRVTASNSAFSTITKFNKSSRVETAFDLLVVDECSTVSNKDMRALLEKADYKLLLLVGDTYQIESIRFGNWFGIARSFIPQASVFELTIPYRSTVTGLLTLWERVRNMDDTILEVIARNEYSTKLDSSIFSTAEADEIILCLNYDGLYGINNINRFLQENNPNPSVAWGIQQFKVGDPILFNESERFAPVIYNNMKGRIVRIKILNASEITEQIQFDIELDKLINGIDADEQEFELLENSPNGNSVIRFCVNKTKNADEDDDDSSEKNIVPFQVAYAVSIHKAQGLEYSSVKVVITDEVDELISHSIFYTAITRARQKLKIYWTPEVENKVLSSIKPKNMGKDVGLLKKYIVS